MFIEYQAFVFDFDGVIADSVEVKTEAFRKLYHSYGEEVSNEVVRYHRENGGMPRAEKFAYYQSELLGTPIANDDLERLNRNFSKLVVDGVINAPEIPGVAAFLREWHGRIPMYVDSAAPDSELSVIIEKRGLAGYFDSVYGSDCSKVNNLKSILNAGGYSPEKVLFFGDALSDYSAAQQCGTAFMGIISFQDSPLLRVDGDFSRCETFDEVSKILRGEE